MTKRILFVDDQAHVLIALRQLFAPTGFEAHFAGSGKEALEILEKQTVDLVVSDLKMPEMDGYQLLREIQKKYPEVIRVMLCGYPEEKEALRALQDGTVKLYLQKPWDNDLMIKTLDQLLETMLLLRSNNLLTIMNKMTNLPTLPDVYQKICSIMESDASLDKVVAEIERDQSITAKILQVANGAQWAVRTGSVKQAVLFLGFANIKPIVLGAALFDTKVMAPLIRRIREGLWDESSRVNELVHLCYSDLLGKKLPDMCAAAGLLHDIGRVVLLSEFGEGYVTAMQLNDLSAERETFGVSHAEAGGWLLNWWNLPQPLVEAALYHAEPAAEQIINRELVSVVHLAHVYAASASQPKMNIKINPAALEFLGLSEEKCAEVLEKAAIEGAAGNKH